MTQEKVLQCLLVLTAHTYVPSLKRHQIKRMHWMVVRTVHTLYVWPTYCFLPEEYGSVASTPDSTPPCTDGMKRWWHWTQSVHWHEPWIHPCHVTPLVLPQVRIDVPLVSHLEGEMLMHLSKKISSLDVTNLFLTDIKWLTRVLSSHFSIY